MYYVFPKTVLNAAITKVGTEIKNKFTENKSKYSAILNIDSFFWLYTILFALLFNTSSNKYPTIPPKVSMLKNIENTIGGTEC